MRETGSGADGKASAPCKARTALRRARSLPPRKAFRLKVVGSSRPVPGTAPGLRLGGFTAEPIRTSLPIEKRKTLTLTEAREKARIGRELAKAGLNPSDEWRQGSAEVGRTFRAVAEECHRQAVKGWKNTKHRDEWLSSLERYAFPVLGDLSPDEVDAAAIQRVLLPIWLPKGETARRVKQRIGTVLDYAHAKGWKATEAPMRATNQLMRGIRQAKGGNFAAMPYADRLHDKAARL